MRLIDRVKKSEKLRERVLALWDELIPQHRTFAEIAHLARCSKGMVHFIVKGRKSRAKGKI